ncbi:MAG: hypothetical protein M1816_001399 [Peltula sp. TS41687]|nr:MAG: hypothetical protein M1816_001399 [Peltula sp. TS41687]
MKYLDEVFRKGVLGGYAHCSENVRISRLLVDQIGVFVDEMGIWSVKHLKYIIPLLSDILAAPFGTASPPLLLSAIRTVHVIILNDWPRLTACRAEILRGLTFCWCRIAEEDKQTEPLEEVKSALKDAYRLLRAAIKDEVDLTPEIEILVRSEEHVRELLEVEQISTGEKMG